MAEDTEDPEREEGADGEGEEGAKKGGLNKMILFIGLPVVIVILLGVAGFLFLMGGGEEEAHAEGEHAGEHADAHGDAHGDGHGDAHGDGHGDGHGPAALPELFQFNDSFINSIQGRDGRLVHIEVKVALAFSDHDLAEMLAREDVQLLLTNEYNDFLRTLRIEDVDGSMGTHRIRMELLRRTNQVLAPKHVDGVLLPSLVMQ